MTPLGIPAPPEVNKMAALSSGWLSSIIVDKIATFPISSMIISVSYHPNSITPAKL